MQELWMFNCKPLYPVCDGQILAVFDSDTDEESIKKAMIAWAEEYGMDARDKDELIFVGEIKINALQNAAWFDFDTKILTLQNGNY